MTSLVVGLLLIACLICPGRGLAQGSLDTGTVSRVETENYLGITDDTRYDVSFKQADLREVLQFLAWIADVNIIIPEGLQGIVNVSFRGIRISDALNSIMRANGLESALEGRVIRVGKTEQFKEAGEDLKSETFRLRYAPAKEMAAKVKTLLSSRGSVIDDERTNSLVVREIPANIENVRRLIDDVDIKDAQVLIESKILEATRSFSRALGIQWGITKAGGSTGIRTAGLAAVGQGDSGRNLNVDVTSTTQTPTGGLFIGSLFKGVNLDVQLLLAEQRGDVYVISDPSVVTSNGKAANIRSGTTLYLPGTGQVNIGTTGTTTSTGSSYQTVETGVELKVTPQITIHDYVKLDIEATTSTPDFTNTVQGIPSVADNTAKTTVLVRDGETTVIGGLTRYTDTLIKKGVPYLSRIPLLGNLFKSKERQAGNAELMVFIRPTVIRVEGQMPAQMRVREMEERRAAMQLDPLVDPSKEAEKKASKVAREKSRRGNKYVK